jgi:hypothetical protein
MELVKVCFDRVFDIRRRERVIRMRPVGRYKDTKFEFESDGKRVFVHVAGWPELEPGMTVVALLREAGDWLRFLGWVDGANGSIVYASTQAPDSFDHARLGLAGTVMYSFLSIPFWAGYSQQQNLVALFFALVLGSFALRDIYNFVKDRRVKRALFQVRDEILKQLAQNTLSSSS